MIAPVIVCVVLTGTPRAVAVNSDTAPAASAAKPPTGCRRVILEPMVWMMRQPPAKVPIEMAACAAITTQNGILNSVRKPPA